MITFHLATTDEELTAIYRFRYDVYVEEMGRYRAVADHARRELVEPEDAYSWNLYAHDGNRVVASNRLTPGTQGFSARQVEHYELAPFLAEMPAEALFVGERMMIDPEYRGTNLAADMANEWMIPVPPEEVRIVFGCCEPHLLSFQVQMGSVPYADHNIGTDEAGYLIPLVAFPQGVDTLRDADGRLPACIQHVVGGQCAVTSPASVGDDAYWDTVKTSLGALQRPGALFENLTDREVRRCVTRSNIIDCAAGDRVVKKCGTARNVFVVLTGALEARDGEQVIGRLDPGDVFGETAFLMQRDRTLDVFALDPGTRILSLSEKTLRGVIHEGAPLAAKLLLNISKTLCARASGRVRSAA